MKRLTILIATLSLAGSAAACGGGGGGDAPPTKAAFIKQADKLCQQMDLRVQRKLQNLLKAYPGLSPAGAQKAIAAKFITVFVLPEIRKEAQALAALQAPRGDQKTIEDYASEIQKGVKETEKGDVTRVFTNDRGRFQRIYFMGQKYGFKICNEPL